MGCNSFAGATRVVLADGSSKPIDQVRVGDEVTNAAPGSSFVGPHVVTAVHVTYTDRAFDDVSVATSSGPATITTTARHLFWDVTTRAWTAAQDLRLGDQLDTPGEGRATVVGSRHYTATITTYNLTIDTTHTYYVLAGDTPVLVHNCGPELDKLSAAATGEIKPGVTPATIAYRKHMIRPNTSLIKLGGRDAREMSGYLVGDILTNPRTALQSWTHPVHGPVYDFQLPDIGARWSQSGAFIGFLER